MSTTEPGHPEERRKHGDEQPRVDAEEQHLEDRVEGDQARRILRGTLGELVPDDHHRDAARQADHDEADHVFRLVVQEDDRQREHQHRPDDPVLHQRQRQHLPVAEDVGQLLVAHLRKRRVHHQHQADRDGDVGRSDLEAIDEILDARHEEPEADAQGHGREDPDGQIPVEKRELAGDGAHGWLRYGNRVPIRSSSALRRARSCRILRQRQRKESFDALAQDAVRLLERGVDLAHPCR